MPAVAEDQQPILEHEENEGDQKDEEDDELVKVDCRGRCKRCLDECWAQCRRSCTLGGFLITLVHIIIFLSSLMIAVLTTVNKKHVAYCLLNAEFNQDSGGYSCCKTNVMCEYALYYGLCSSALTFLFIMINWVGGLYKARRWLQIQVVFNVLGMIGQLVAAGMQTVGFFMWCDHLLQATQCPVPTIHCKHVENRGCYTASKIYDSRRGNEGIMQHFFTFILTTLIGNWFTFILWLVSCLAVTIQLVQKPSNDNAEDEDDNDENNHNVRPPEPAGQPQPLVPGGNGGREIRRRDVQFKLPPNPAPNGNI